MLKTLDFKVKTLFYYVALRVLGSLKKNCHAGVQFNMVLNLENYTSLYYNSVFCPMGGVSKDSPLLYKYSELFLTVLNCSVLVIVAFLEVWKRKQAKLAYEWDMMHFEEDLEPPRPAFIASVKETRPNPVTGKDEPYIPRSVRYRRYFCACTAIFMMLILVFIAVFGVVVYRAIVSAVLSAIAPANLKENTRIYTSVTSAMMNLCSITVLGKLYEKMAFALTSWENPRTRSDYQDILTIKMFLFQSVNMYSSFFYIAFFKSNYIVGTPGRYNRIAGKNNGSFFFMSGRLCRSRSRYFSAL